MPTIAQIASGEDFSVLLGTVQFIDNELPGTNLVGTLSGHSQLTVFAPNNAAFGQLAIDLGYTGDAADAEDVLNFLATNVPATTLRDVVLYHVLPGAQSAADIAAHPTLTTALGATITATIPTLVDNEPDLQDPTLLVTDIHASNGIVHVIDRVLLPIDLPGNEAAPTIAAIATGDDTFSILVDTLGFIDANLEGSNLLGAVSDAGADLTVFAPTNAAFGQLAADLGFTGDTADTAEVTTFLIQNVPVETLNAVVTYHISAGGQTAADIAAAGEVTTLQGGTIDAGELPTLGDKEPDLIDPSLIATDIEAANGVVHVIDRVLLPVDLPGNDAPTITDIAVASGEGFDNNAQDFDILREAVIAADLAGALADVNADLTVFAPTDGAFVGLAQNLGFQGTDEGEAFAYIVDAARLLSAGGDPIPLIKDILLYHVSPSSLQASQVLAIESIPTLLGVDLGRDGTSLVDGEPDLPNPNLIATDIQAANGIVHVIDGVLVPVDLLQSDGNDKVDFVIAGDDRDYISTGRDNDFIDAKGGNDLVHSGSGDDTVLLGAGNDRISAGSGDDTVLGEDGRDLILGRSGRDSIDGGDGNDIISGGRGMDNIAGGEGNDLILGGRNSDVIDGGAGNDRILGGDHHDQISGGAGRDIIAGNYGDDTINSGEGNDRMYGGWGKDTFVFAEGDGRDVIFDFDRRGDDVIDLTAYGFDSTDDFASGVTGNSRITRIDLGDDEIVLVGTGVHTLTTDDFIL